MIDRDTAPATSTFRPFDTSRGTNQSGVRLYNERLVLSLIRRHTSLPKVELARRTGLSVQTINDIVGRLEAEGLLLRLDPQRGRVGQPAIPFALNPEGAFSVGLKIGRRSTDLVLIDFCGQVRHRRHAYHPFPLPQAMLAFVRRAVDEVLAELDPAQQARVAGLGIAMPFELWNWEAELGAAPGAMAGWRGFDAETEIGAIAPWPVVTCNDATAACAAELFLGDGWRFRDFLYVFIGSFIGGGVVLNGSLYPGRTGNAGAIGSFPVGGGRPRKQLIRVASLRGLEAELCAAGLDPAPIYRTTEAWPDYGPPLDRWIDRTAGHLAELAVAAAAIIDFEAVVIDGAFPASVRTRLRERTARAQARFDPQGLSPLVIGEGSIGSDARAIGGAALPLLANFARDRDVLFKDANG
jgi:predicted NBD/HSP70 family sugar kinase